MKLKNLLFIGFVPCFLISACSIETKTPVTITSPEASTSPEAAVIPQKVSSIEIKESDLGKSWPLTVPGGVLECVAPQRIIFRAEGKVYAVNGSAKSAGMLPIDPIWKDNPEIQGTKISISDLLNRGLELCQ